MISINWANKNQPAKLLKELSESIKNDLPGEDDFYELFFKVPGKEKNYISDYLDSVIENSDLTEEVLDSIFDILEYASLDLEFANANYRDAYNECSPFETIFYKCFDKLVTLSFNDSKTQKIFENQFCNKQEQKIQYRDLYNWLEYKDASRFAKQITDSVCDWYDVGGVLFLIRFFKAKKEDVYNTLVHEFNKLDFSDFYKWDEFFKTPFEYTISELKKNENLSNEEKRFLDKLVSTLSKHS